MVSDPGPSPSRPCSTAAVFALSVLATSAGRVRPGRGPPEQGEGAVGDGAGGSRAQSWTGEPGAALTELAMMADIASSFVLVPRLDVALSESATGD